MSTGCSLAYSCSEILSRKTSNAILGDGEYKLAAPGCKLVRVHCANMTGTPFEYISLIEHNYSKKYGQHDGPFTTTFSKVRIDLPSVSMILFVSTFKIACFGNIQYHVFYMREAHFVIRCSTSESLGKGSDNPVFYKNGIEAKYLAPA